ncbi:MAG: SCP2 sterol-binding domain-containing protein [Archaeoglobaceae archaeon]|nr:SCP2 sterol-binding domain-containing protein [Archaeoglobaceae archaeon]MDW8117749.1 SCP2 sterol-binding domain-containing protein [Archaeoglobaceae archaeon]
MVSISYPDRGFPNVVGQLIEQKLKENPKKAEIAKKMRGKIFLEIRNIGVGATVELDGENIKVTNEKPEKDFALISVSDYDTLTLVSSSGLLKQMRLMLSGKLKIKKIGLARKFGILLS